MANSALLGATIELPDEVMEYLKQKQKIHSSEGGKRISQMVQKGICTYEQLKRIKHDIENVYTDKESWDYLLQWINLLLEKLRSYIKNQKNNQELAGKENVHKADHDVEYTKASKVSSHKSDFMESYERATEEEYFKKHYTKIINHKTKWKREKAN